MATVKGFTVMESLVSAVLITVAFGLTGMIFLGVGNSLPTYRVWKAESVVRQVASTELESDELRSRSYQFDDFIVETKLLPYLRFRDVQLLKVECRDEKGELLAASKHLITHGE